MTLAAPPRGHHVDHDVRGCPLYRMLEPALRVQAEQKPHLWSYLEGLPLDTIGPPAYHETLGRKLRDLKNPNLIYPVGQGLFVHICPDPEDSRDVYVALEPGMGEDLNELIAAVESRLLDLVEELEKLDSTASRKEILLKAIGRVCTTRSRPSWMATIAKSG